jgi:putative glutamine amidotransferase
VISSLLKQEQAFVNSHHHQAVDKLGTNLTATSWAKDGVIESIEDTSENKFLLGVQWHPELSWKIDEFSKKVFEVFINKCVK